MYVYVIIVRTCVRKFGRGYVVSGRHRLRHSIICLFSPLYSCRLLLSSLLYWTGLSDIYSQVYRCDRARSNLARLFSVARNCMRAYRLAVDWTDAVLQLTRVVQVIFLRRCIFYTSSFYGDRPRHVRRSTFGNRHPTR